MTTIEKTMRRFAMRHILRCGSDTEGRTGSLCRMKDSPSMLLEEFREALAALPSYALVEVRDQTGSRAAIGAVDYDSGVIRVGVDDVLLVSVDDVDEDSDSEADDVVYLSTFRHRARMFGDGCNEGYPLCCVLFFVLLWTPVARSRHAILRRLVDCWAPGPCHHIPCPWHRWRSVAWLDHEEARS